MTKRMNLELHKKCDKCSGSGFILDTAQVGAALREQRLKSGMRMSKIAAALGISPCYVFDLEKGRRPFRGDMIKRYEALLK